MGEGVQIKLEIRFPLTFFSKIYKINVSVNISKAIKRIKCTSVPEEK